MTPVDLIIPDAGPPISLAHAGRLDLVEVFNTLVALVDIVNLVPLIGRTQGYA